MKNFLIAFSFLCVGAMMSAEASVLVLQSNDWFKVTTTDSESHGGTVTATSPAKWEKIESDKKFKVSSDLSNRVTFEAANPLSESDPLAQKFANVTLNLEAAIVPTGFLDTLTGSDKVAFALYQESESQAAFKAWLNGTWTPLTGPSVPSEGTAYTLLMEFDNRDETSKKVRFTVTVNEVSTVLKDTGNAEWLTYATTAITKNVDFIGNGIVKDFMGQKLKIIAEIVVVDNGTITIKEEDMEKFRKTMSDTKVTYSSVDDFIKANASEAFGDDFKTAGVPVGAAYVLGLVADDGTGKMVPVADGELKATPVATAGDTQGIKLALNVSAIENHEDTGATITYQVVDESTQSTTEGLVIPKGSLPSGSQMKVFKVQAVVKPAKK